MSEKEGQDHFSTLPYEILLQIFQICKKQEEEEKYFYNVNRVSDLRLVCKKFHQVAWDPMYLTELELRHCHLERLQDFEPVLSPRPYLTTLRLDLFSEELGKCLEQASTLCPKLKSLEITSFNHFACNNPLTYNSLLSLICQCKHLELLGLPYIPRGKIVDLSMLSKLKKLRTLGLRECGVNFTGSKVSQCLKRIVGLETLEIICNDTFCESDLEAVVESCPNLKFLTLDACSRLDSEDMVLRCTAPLKKLEKLKYEPPFFYDSD